MFPKEPVKALFKEGHFINWGADPFARMGYSYNQVGSEKQRQVLAQPVEDKLFFAGEATHKIYPATVHGAMLSGVRVAKQINSVFRKHARKHKR